MSKTQIVRLIDVFFIGPFMIWYGNKYYDQEKIAALILIYFTTGKFKILGNEGLKHCHSPS